MSALEKFNQTFDKPDFAKLILRVGFAGMFLLHGIHKISGGTAFIANKFTELGLPEFLAKLVYLGEVIAPILIILGVFTRLSAVIAAGCCIVIALLMHPTDLFALAKTGAWTAEHVATFFVGFGAIFFLGAGRYALKPNS